MTIIFTDEIRKIQSFLNSDVVVKNKNSIISTVVKTAIIFSTVILLREMCAKSIKLSQSTKQDAHSWNCAFFKEVTNTNRHFGSDNVHCNVHLATNVH